MNTQTKANERHQLAPALARIGACLHSLSALKLAEEFYTKQEREQFYAALEECHAQEKQANDDAAKANDNTRPAIYQRRDDAIIRAAALRREHPLLSRLHHMKTATI